MTRITPFLWFDGNAEEAMTFYVSLLPDSRITEVSRQGGAETPAFLVSAVLDGREYQALNGGPHYVLNPAFSLSVSCPDQAEVDRLWAALGEGGQELQCGWLTDRFGLTWQILPARLAELLQDPDRDRADRVMQAMLGMTKIDVAGLEAAASR